MSNTTTIPISLTQKIRKARQAIDEIEKEVAKIGKPKKSSKKITRRRMTEEDVLKLIEQGEKDYREGKAEPFDDFIRRELPELAHLLSG